MAGIEVGRPDGTPFAAEQFAGSAICDRARAHGVIVRPLGDVVVWMPPFSATDDDLQLLATATARAIEEATDDLLRDRH
jgi:adenosylmethionine-8-amino-7-oxononanoate aminotransferase